MKKVGFRKKNNDVISSMYFSAAVAMIFSQVAGVVATIIDGIITSRFLGPDSLSSISLVGPFILTLALVSGFISTGSQVVCGSLVGEGKRKEANALFSISIIITILAAFFFIFLCTTFPDVIFKICGVTIESHPKFYDGMKDYIYGYMFGIPAVMVIQIIGPFVVMDNGKTFFTISAFILCISDVAGDLVNAFFIHGDITGMGIATTISFYIQLIFLLSFYLRKNSYFRFSFSNLRFIQLFEIAKEGMPTLVRKFATVLRDLFISRINLSVALTGAAVAARAMQNDLNTLMFCIGLGMGKALLSIVGIYYSSNDKNGLKNLFAYSVKMAIVLSGAVAAILFIFADLIAGFYTSDPEVIMYSAFSLRCMAISLVMDTLLVTFQYYLQGIRNRLLVNLFNFGERFIIPVIIALTMGSFWGSKGVLASIAVGKAVLILLIFVIICVHLKRLPCHLEDFMFLPEGFGGREGENSYAFLESIEDVIRESKNAEEFCLAHGCDAKKARHMGCFVEEMAGNIIIHGKPKAGKKVFVDYRLYTKDGDICLTLRDYCNQFNPTDFYKAHNDGDPEKYIGIRLVTKMAKEMSYFNAFNSNNMIIYL